MLGRLLYALPAYSMLCSSKGSPAASASLRRELGQSSNAILQTPHMISCQVLMFSDGGAGLM